MKTIKVYLFLLSATIFFFGLIFITGELAGNDMLSYFPEFSWDMINSWDEIVKK